MRTYTFKKCPRVHSLHFAPDGVQLLAIGGSSEWSFDSAIGIDLDTGEEIGRLEIGAADACAVDPALTRLVAGGTPTEEGGPPLMWVPLTGGEWHDLDVGEDIERVCGLAFDPSGKYLAIASETPVPQRKSDRWSRDRSGIDIYRFPQTKKPPTKIASATTSYSTSAIAFNADSTRVAVGAGVRGVNDFAVFDVKTGWRVYDFDPDLDEKRGLAFLPDGRLVASASQFVYIVPANGGEPEFVLGEKKNRARVNGLAVTPDGAQILAAMNNGTVRVWYAAAGEAGKTLNWRIGALSAVAVSHDGLKAAAAGTKGRVVVWDVDA